MNQKKLSFSAGLGNENKEVSDPRQRVTEKQRGFIHFETI